MANTLQAFPSANQPVPLAIPAGGTVEVTSIRVANQSGSLADSFSIAFVPQGNTLGQQNWIYYNIPLPALNAYFETTQGMYCDPGDAFWVTSQNGQSSFAIWTR